MSTTESRLVSALPEWKQRLWRDLSSAAQRRSAFENDDYDENGDLIPRLEQFAELYKWLAARRSGSQFETIRPVWRYIDGGRWELLFHEVRHAAAGERTCRRTTGLIIHGCIPSDQLGEDWIMVGSRSIPTEKELVEGTDTDDGYCYLM